MVALDEVTTLNPGDTYRFKIIDNMSGALDYDTSLEWGARVLHVNYSGEEMSYIKHEEYEYTGERVISVTVPDVSTVTRMDVYFDATCQNYRPEYLPDSIADAFVSDTLTFTVN